MFLVSNNSFSSLTFKFTFYKLLCPLPPTQSTHREGHTKLVIKHGQTAQQSILTDITSFNHHNRLFYKRGTWASEKPC